MKESIAQGIRQNLDNQKKVFIEHSGKGQRSRPSRLLKNAHLPVKPESVE